MPIPVQCPNPACGASAPVADSLNGRRVRCKLCGTPFVARPSLDGAPARTPPAPSFPVLPAVFGRYKVLRLLGQGGMGAVYLADDSQLGRTVALKIPVFDGADAPARAERFVREARSAAALHHPNICTIFDAGEIAGTPFLTMAYLPGTPLDREIDPDRPMPELRAAWVARTIALALAHAHAKGIVHRDLKPANVMMTADDEPVVMDFGLAKQAALDDPAEVKASAPGAASNIRLTRTGGLLGTPGYMSPEQVKGDPAAVGPASDVYSLGVILFEMLTGKPPYSGSVNVVLGRVLSAPVPGVQEFRPAADPRLAAVCERAMAKIPAARFQSMTEFADALGVYLTAQAGSATGTMTARPSVSPDAPRPWFADPPQGSPPKPRRRPRWPYPAALAGLALFILAGLWVGGVFKGKPPAVAATDPAAVGPEQTPEGPPEPKAPAVVFAPEGSEWAGTGTVRNETGDHPIAGAWRITERSGAKFTALWRGGRGGKNQFDGTIDPTGQITLEGVEQLSPEAKPRKEIRGGTGEVSRRRFAIEYDGPHDDPSPRIRVEFKLIPDGGEGFRINGRWHVHHEPGPWRGHRTVTDDDHTTDNPYEVNRWERDGGMFIFHFNTGREWVVIDPDNPNKMHGTNGIQSATWVRQ